MAKSASERQASNKKVAAATAAKSASTQANNPHGAAGVFGPGLNNRGAAGVTMGNNPVQSGTTPTTTTKTVTTPVAPFLTPEQQAALIQLDMGFQGKITSDQQGMQQAPIDEQRAEAQNVHDAAVSTANANALAAARGVFASGMNQSSLSDIATSLATTNLTLRTNLGTQIGNLAADVKTQTDNQGGTDSAYKELAAENGANQNPTTSTVTTPVTPPTTAAAPVAPTSPVSTQQPVQKQPSRIKQLTEPTPSGNAGVPTVYGKAVAAASAGRTRNISASVTPNVKVNFPKGMGAY